MRRSPIILVTLVVLLAVPFSAFAAHQWGSYHWARQSNPFTLKAHDNVSSKWDAYVNGAAGEPGIEDYWNSSSYLRVDIIPNSPLSSVKRCTSVTGKIEICSAAYGRNGWLGIAGISVTGGHISKGYTKLNDTYFDTASYNKPEWRRLVACQEIGHDFGLGHTDETFDNANHGTCMDYTNDPDGSIYNQPSNEYPNSHDYQMLNSMYQHTDSTTTVAGILDEMTQALSRPVTMDEIIADAGQWGIPVKFNRDGKPTVFMMPLGPDHEQDGFELTHVFWAPQNPFEGHPEIERPTR